MIRKFNLFFLTLFNIGKIKYAPGTVASLVTCLAFILLINILDILILFFITLIIILYFFIAVNNTYDQFDTNDPQEIVIDNVVGQMLPLLSIPIYETLYPLPQLYYCVAAFVLFRIFDIWKPFPINYIDNRTEGALGIILDDILAGTYTIIILTMIFLFFGG